jgi:hypothetical protein
MHPEPMIRSGSGVGRSDYLQRKGFDISFNRNFGVTEETGEQVQNERVFANAWVAIMKHGLTSQAAADRACKRVEEIFAKYPIAQG